MGTKPPQRAGRSAQQTHVQLPQPRKRYVYLLSAHYVLNAACAATTNGPPRAWPPLSPSRKKEKLGWRETSFPVEKTFQIFTVAARRFF
jgi:hypothetical protein